jgi:hypothetical protein
MRHLIAAVAVAAIGMSVAGCGSSNQSGPASSSSSTTTTTTTTTPTKPPIAQAALAGLLLTPAEIDSLLGTTGMASQEKIDKPQDDNVKQHWPQGWTWPVECLYALNPGETPAYADSAFSAFSGDDDTAPLPPGSAEVSPEVTQVVALFPSANEANTFFTTSSQRWSACANRQLTTPGDADNPEIAWKIGPTSNANGILTTTLSMSATKNGTTRTAACQRALTVRNNARQSDRWQGRQAIRPKVFLDHFPELIAR